MRILVDVNVLVDAIEDRNPFNIAAQQIVLYVEQHLSESFITADSLTNLYYVIHHLSKSKVKTRQIIGTTIELFHILDVNETDCQLALTSNCPDFEDAILIETARRHRIDYIITRNTKDFANSPVPALTPAEFLAKVQHT